MTLVQSLGICVSTSIDQCRPVSHQTLVSFVRCLFVSCCILQIGYLTIFS